MGQPFSEPLRAPSRNHTLLPLATRNPRRWAGPVVPDIVPSVVRVVLEKKGQFYLVGVDITSADSIQAVADKIRATKEKVVHHTNMFKPLYGLFWGQCVTIATLSTVSRVAPPQVVWG